MSGDNAVQPARTAQVIVASTRAATGVYPDRTGPVIEAWLSARGWSVHERAVVTDGPAVGAALSAAIAAGLRLVITTGGTGLSPTDHTPEETLPFLARQIPGLMEELRRRGTRSTPLAILSRGYAGVTAASNGSPGTVIINLPGSTGGVADGLSVLDDVLDHLCDQLTGLDHTVSVAATPTTERGNR